MDNFNFNINEKHLLEGEDVKQMNCPKNTVHFSAGMPDTIVLHYTAGRNGRSSAEYLCKDNVKASAHLVVDRDGKVFQLVPFDTVAWHAGKSRWKDRTGLNNYSIGIEIDNAGVLTKSGTAYTSWFGKKLAADEVMEAVHRNESKARYWHLFTEKQIEALEALCDLLIDRYPAIKEILGHEEISPGRKLDPGPAFPLDKLRQRIINDRDEEGAPLNNPPGVVNVPFLNIRQLPDVKAERVAEPLPQGTNLIIYEEHDGWFRVKAEIEGWVAGQYVDLDSDN